MQELKTFLLSMAQSEITKSIIGALCVFLTLYILLLLAYGLEGITHVHRIRNCLGYIVFVSD